MDLASLLGVILGIVLLGGSIIMGGNAVIFLSLESLMIVLGGTAGGTMVGYSLAELKKIPALISVSFADTQMDSEEIIEILVEFAEKARREGLLALEQDVRQVDDSFLQRGIQLVVDGTDPELVRNILETKLTFLEERHNKSQNMFRTMGSLSPAFGMIGTLIGLIEMLSRLENPDELGGGMAVALITTLYGAVMANLFFIPIAQKLQLRSEEEVLMKEVMIEGVLSIQAGENPRIVEEKLRAFLADSGAEESEAGTEPEELAVGENV
ncbi:MAG: motility protein A [Halanaerobiaceae bacterium]